MARPGSLLQELRHGGERCIYCASPAQTVEHMPPIWLFSRRLRPKGLEFGACATCNRETAAADLVVGWFARLTPFGGGADDPLWEEAKKRQDAIRQKVPGLFEELGRSESSEQWTRTPAGILRPLVRVDANGPILAAHMNVFGAKLAMALFREHVGHPLPEGGAAYVQPFFNGGIQQHQLDKIIEIMPGQGTLSQGKFSVADQFIYRFNTDGKEIVGALAAIHSNVFYLVFATSNVGHFGPTLTSKTAAVFRLGELPGRLRMHASMKPRPLQRRATIIQP